MGECSEYTLNKPCETGFIAIGDMARKLNGRLSSIEALHEVESNITDATQVNGYAFVVVLADATNAENLTEAKRLMELFWEAEILVYPVLITEDDLSMDHPVFQINPTEFQDIADMQNVILESIQGFTDMVCSEAMVSLELDDVKELFDGQGCLSFVQSMASGKEGCATAAKDAANKIKDKLSADSVIVVNIVGNEHLGMMELMESTNAMCDELGSDDMFLMWGARIDKDLKDTVKVLLWARG